MRYKYWHIVTDVSEEWKQKHPEFHKGMIITHQYKHDGYGVDMIDFSIGKEYSCAYTLAYLGRVSSTIHDKELFEILKYLIIEKGHYELWEKGKKEEEKNDKDRN